MSDKVREGFRVHVEREYANDDGLHWGPGYVPFIHQNGSGRMTWLEEEWDLWQAAHAAGRREGVEEAIHGCVSVSREEDETAARCRDDLDFDGRDLHEARSEGADLCTEMIRALLAPAPAGEVEGVGDVAQTTARSVGVAGGGAVRLGAPAGSASSTPSTPPPGRCQLCHGTGRIDNHVTGEVECYGCDGVGFVPTTGREE